MGVPFTGVIFWLVLKLLTIGFYTLAENVEKHPIQIVNFTSTEIIFLLIPQCSFFQKYSNFTNILISVANCQSSISLVVSVLKICKQPTDAFHIAIFEENNDGNGIGQSQNWNDFTNVACKCLFSETGTLFLNRGVTHNVQEGIQIHVQQYCKVLYPHDKDQFGINSSDHLIIGNQFSMKHWNALRTVEEVLLPTRNVSASSTMAVKIELQEFSTSAICLHLLKMCSKPNKKENSGSAITALIQGNLSVVVYVLPKSDHPWEIEFSPAVYFDQLIFTMIKEWKHNENIKFVKSFGMDLWIFLVAFIFFLASSLLLLAYVKNKINPDNYKHYSGSASIQLVCFSLVMSLLEQPTKIFARHIEVYMILGFWFLLLTNLTTNYKSKLVENLIKREKIVLPSTIDELLNNSEFRVSHNLISGMAPSIKGIGGPKVNEIISRSEMYTNASNSGQNPMACLAYTLVDKFACLTLENVNKRDATMLSTTLGLTNGSINKIWHISERSTGIYAMWAYRRGFPFKEKFNDALGRILQAGLPIKWFKTVLSLTKFLRNENFNMTTIFPRNVSKDYETKLKEYITKNRRRLPDSELLVMKHIKPVFNLCFIVLCFSMFIFMSEVLISKCNAPKIKRVSKFYNNIEIKIIVSHYYTPNKNN